MVDSERLTKLFLDLVRIDGPSRRERKVADYVKAKLEALGLEPHEDDTAAKIDGTAGNVVAFVKGDVPGARSIFFSAHLDTVEPTEKLNVQQADGEISSDGTTILGADDRAGVSVIIEAMQTIIEKKLPHGDIQILFSVSEEVGLCGARSMDPKSIRGQFGYVFDTEKPVAGITVSAPTHATIMVEVNGKAAHAGMAPENGVSAIVAASNAISKMKLGRIDEETTANVGIIEGGKARNIIPEHVTIKAEARSRNVAKLTAQVEHMRKLFEDEAARIGAAAVVEVDTEYESYRWTEQDAVVQLAMAASRKVGIEPIFEEGGGGSDANVFNAAGIPAVVVGVGYDNSHSSSECISIQDLADAAEFAVALAQVAAGE